MREQGPALASYDTESEWRVTRSRKVESWILISHGTKDWLVKHTLSLALGALN